MKHNRTVGNLPNDGFEPPASTTSHASIILYLQKVISVWSALK